MGFVASDSGGGDFKKVPQGVHMGRCYSLIDLGTQLVRSQHGDKQLHKIRIAWELFGEDNDGNPLTIERDGNVTPMTINKSYTLSLNEKANLRKDLESWRGRAFTDEEAKGFDISKLLNVYCMINVTHSETNGKTYANVASITPIPSALKNAKPEPIHEVVVFDLDNPDWAVFDSFHDKLKDAIKTSPEYAMAAGHSSGQSPAGGSGFDDMESEF